MIPFSTLSPFHPAAIPLAFPSHPPPIPLPSPSHSPPIPLPFPSHPPPIPLPSPSHPPPIPLPSPSHSPPIPLPFSSHPPPIPLPSPFHPPAILARLCARRIASLPSPHCMHAGCRRSSSPPIPLPPTCHPSLRRVQAEFCDQLWDAVAAARFWYTNIDIVPSLYYIPSFAACVCVCVCALSSTLVLLPPSSTPTIFKLPPSNPTIFSLPPSTPTIFSLPPSTPTIFSLPPSTPTIFSLPPSTPTIFSLHQLPPSSSSTPTIFSLPPIRSQARLNELFPDGRIYTHVARYLLHPDNQLWDEITSLFHVNLAQLPHRLGVQVRSPSESDLSVVHRVLDCALNISHYLPPTSPLAAVSVSPFSPVSSLSHLTSASESPYEKMVVFVSSLTIRHLMDLRHHYLHHHVPPMCLTVPLRCLQFASRCHLAHVQSVGNTAAALQARHTAFSSLPICPPFLAPRAPPFPPASLRMFSPFLFSPLLPCVSSPPLCVLSSPVYPPLPCVSSPPLCVLSSLMPSFLLCVSSTAVCTLSSSVFSPSPVFPLLSCVPSPPLCFSLPPHLPLPVTACS
ncbi:unnamed protein product [Closterium sp. Naga37s-1]|nr:unnamed protein product [Closterium sp. Naga37s-1]